ncbi:MAG: hypothetical protein IPN76_04115 [Saprospiraceae bacterium]|nr:hypothetical protein [Saprospiraceae bacterium]
MAVDRPKINRLPNVHLVDRYMGAVEPLGVKRRTGLGFLESAVPQSAICNPQSAIPPHYFRHRAQYQTKRPPTAKIIEICTAIGQTIVLLGGKRKLGKVSKLQQNQVAM